jgi:hypothetical protein
VIIVLGSSSTEGAHHREQNFSGLAREQNVTANLWQRFKERANRCDDALTYQRLQETIISGA